MPGMGPYGKKMAGASLMGGLMSGGSGFITAGLIQLGGGILGALTSKKTKRQRSSQEIYFDNLTSFYSDLGKKSKMARSMARAISPTMDTSGIGEIDPMKAFETGGFPESLNYTNPGIYGKEDDD